MPTIENVLGLFGIFEWLAAFGAFSVNNNAGAGAIGTKDPVFEIESVSLINHFSRVLFESNSTVDAV